MNDYPEIMAKLAELARCPVCNHLPDNATISTLLAGIIENTCDDQFNMENYDEKCRTL